MSDRLFTPRFLVMCLFSFTVFVSAFQLLPAAPYRILQLGGSTVAAGLFLGFLTYASALSAPFTGPIGDRLGQRHVLIVVSIVLALCTASYAFIGSHYVMLAVVIVHGLFWSALLTASGAYMTATVPASRRAEGLSYWGLASVISMAVAPPLGFWVYRHGWFTLCIELTILNAAMAVIAWRLPDDPPSLEASDSSFGAASPRSLEANESSFRTASPLSRASFLSTWAAMVEWRVMLLSVAMALVSFGYGAITSFSALFADELHVAPRSIFLTSMAAAILVGRLTIGRTIDRLGRRRVLLPSLLGPPIGLAILSIAQGPVSLVLAGLAFGAGFGLMYPAYTAYIMEHVASNRRGAAFGAMLAAFDTGIGTGSSVVGWLTHGSGFRRAFAATAVLAFCALPSFLLAERWLGFREK